MFTNKNLDEFKAYIKGKYVAIMGMGISNTPLIKYLMDLDANITVFDKKTEEELDKALIEEYAIQGVKFSLGENYLKNFVGRFFYYEYLCNAINKNRNDSSIT